MGLAERIAAQRERIERANELAERQHAHWHRITDDGRKVGSACKRADCPIMGWHDADRARQWMARVSGGVAR